MWFHDYQQTQFTYYNIALVMGSRITRTLSITDRNRRVHPSSQNEVKSFIKAMSSSMFGFLAFSLGLLTSRSSFEPAQNCLECLVFATTSALILNSTNQQLCLICGWLLIVIQTLFLKSSMITMFHFGGFLTLYSIFTNIFNYYEEPNWGFLKNMKASAIVVVVASLLEIGHCSGHFVKLINQQQQINFGMRIMLCFLGILVIALTVMAHVHIRSRRFVPIGPAQQVDYLRSLKIIPLIQIILLTFGLRSLLLNTQVLHKCWDGLYLILTLIFTILIMIASSYTMRSLLQKFHSPSIPTILTILLIPLTILSHILSLPSYISYPLSLLLCQLTIMHITNKIENELRINYVLAFIVGIICQINNYQHMHEGINVGISGWILVGVGIGGGVVIQTLFQAFFNKRRYIEVSPEFQLRA